MILQHLKQATRTDHMALEQTVDIVAQLQSIDTYRRLLGRFLGIYAPLEQLLAQTNWHAHGVSLDGRLKTTAIVQDLAIIGTPQPAIDALPRCADLPTITTFPYALGCLYVLEGATLGGQIIAREARTRLGLTPEHGCSFFASYGREIGPMWRQFGGWLVAAAVDERAEAEIVGGAQATFGAFGRWLAQPEDHR